LVTLFESGFDSSHKFVASESSQNQLDFLMQGTDLVQAESELSYKQCFVIKGLSARLPSS